MSLPVPYHLDGIAELLAAKRDTVTLGLRCACGCERFFVYENTLSPAEQAELAEYERICGAKFRHKWGVTLRTEEDGRQHTYARGLLGFPHEIMLPERPFFADFARISVCCEKCGKETVLFDNRFHGYNGAVCGSDAPPDYTPLMKQKFARQNPARRIRIVLTCTVPEEEFAEIMGAESASQNLYSECFTEIAILSETAPGKYRAFFSEETA